MKGARDDARTARDRCLEAMVAETDECTRLSLWRAAKRYHERIGGADDVEDVRARRCVEG